MSDPPAPAPPRVDWTPPSVDLNRIRKVVTYEVMEDQLERLDEIVDTENRALGFASLTTGVFVSAGLSWLAASSLTPVASAVHAGATLASAILAVAFGIQWMSARGKRPRLIDKIRAGAAGP